MTEAEIMEKLGLRPWREIADEAVTHALNNVNVTGCYELRRYGRTTHALISLLKFLANNPEAKAGYIAAQSGMYYKRLKEWAIQLTGDYSIADRIIHYDRILGILRGPLIDNRRMHERNINGDYCVLYRDHFLTKAHP